MRALALLSLALLACGGPPTPSVTPPDPAPGQLLSALKRGDVDAGVWLLAADARFVEPTRDVHGRDEVTAALRTLVVPSAALVDKHHEVARLALGDGSLLFVRSDGAGAVTEVLRFPPSGGAQVTAPVAAYQAAWNVAARTAQLEEGWAVGGRYVDPTAEGEGRDGLSRVIDGFRAQFPGATLDAAGEVQQLAGGWLTFTWVLTSRDSVLHGFDVGRLDDAGQLDFIAGFFSER